MVANYDRILQEIRREAQELASAEISAEELANLIMEIVDLEDRHLLKPIDVNKEVKGLLLKQVNRYGADAQ